MAQCYIYIFRMSDDGFTLDELSERTGIERRTLRSWVSEGLLSPPFKPGRGARYPASNAVRALAVRVLKDLYGFSLSEIGRRFLMATEDQIREWVLEAGPTVAPRGSARDYLNRIRAHSAAEEPEQRPMDVSRKGLTLHDPEHSTPESGFRKPSMRSYEMAHSEERQADLASIERLILQLEKVLEAPAPRRSRRVIWARISITPDLELSVRGDLEPRERILFEQLADQFRAILTGRTKNE